MSSYGFLTNINMKECCEVLWKLILIYFSNRLFSNSVNVFRKVEYGFRQHGMCEEFPFDLTGVFKSIGAFNEMVGLWYKRKIAVTVALSVEDATHHLLKCQSVCDSLCLRGNMQIHSFLLRDAGAPLSVANEVCILKVCACT